MVSWFILGVATIGFVYGQQANPAAPEEPNGARQATAGGAAQDTLVAAASGYAPAYGGYEGYGNYGGCYGRPAGSYGDASYDCKTYQVCQADGRLDTLYCPPYTRFNNYLGICDWHFKVDQYCNPLYKEEYYSQGYNNYDQGYGSNYNGGNNYNSGYDNYAPKYDNYAPKHDNYAPKYDNYAPKQDSYAPKYDNYAPKQDSYAQKYDSYAPKYDTYAPKYDSYAPKYDAPKSYDAPQKYSAPLITYEKPSYGNSYQSYSAPRDHSYGYDNYGYVPSRANVYGLGYGRY